jgi:hypothetical protein
MTCCHNLADGERGELRRYQWSDAADAIAAANADHPGLFD